MSIKNRNVLAPDDATIQVTWGDGSRTALLTVRGKDHDLTPAQLRSAAAALVEAAADIDGGDNRRRASALTEQRHRHDRIVAIASRIIAGMIESGEIDTCPRHADYDEDCPCCRDVDDDVRAAMPEAIATARAAYDAAKEYVSG